MTQLQEITLGDPKFGVTLGNNTVLKLGDERFKMIKVGEGKMLLKGKEHKFFLERVSADWVYIDVFGTKALLQPPQIHLLRALLKMNCDCSTCNRKKYHA